MSISIKKGRVYLLRNGEKTGPLVQDGDDLRDPIFGYCYSLEEGTKGLLVFAHRSHECDIVGYEPF